MLNAGSPSAHRIMSCMHSDDLPMPDWPTTTSEPPRHSQRLPSTLFGSWLVS